MTRKNKRIIIIAVVVVVILYFKNNIFGLTGFSGFGGGKFRPGAGAGGTY